VQSPGVPDLKSQIKFIQFSSFYLEFFGSLIYSRAYVCSHSLEKKIQKEDSDWFNNSTMAERIRNNYMKYGFSRDIDELLKDWGIDPYFFPE
jgi:oligoendopeptidase F